MTNSRCKRGQLTIEVMGVVGLVLMVYALSIKYASTLDGQGNDFIELTLLERACSNLQYVFYQTRQCGRFCRIKYDSEYETGILDGVATLRYGERSFVCLLQANVKNKTLGLGEYWVIDGEFHKNK
ncbi:MAG: hypothetical protein KKD39_03410 [Candidatus Altiarchaeota archaeon]|nr:hypothetical protein [Candidatus Altiarchaeota archaeon]